jgi:hypothetical protein
MPPVTFTARDLLKGKVVKPSYYRVRIDGVEERLSANGASTNWFIEGTILKDADSGSEEFAGVPTPHWMFNSKALGFAVPLLDEFDVEVKPGMRFDFASLAGKECDVFIGNKTYEGRLVNEINHQYRKMKA